MEIMFGFLKENAQFKEETKKLLKRLHQLRWMQLHARKWVTKQLH
jgi:hypothetical protein